MIFQASTNFILVFSSAFIKFTVVQYFKKELNVMNSTCVLCLSHSMAYDFSNKASKSS